MAKKEAISVRVSFDTKEKLLAICEQEHRTQSEQISYWIENYKLEEKDVK